MVSPVLLALIEVRVPGGRALLMAVDAAPKRFDEGVEVGELRWCGEDLESVHREASRVLRVAVGDGHGHREWAFAVLVKLEVDGVGPPRLEAIVAAEERHSARRAACFIDALLERLLHEPLQLAITARRLPCGALHHRAACL